MKRILFGLFFAVMYVYGIFLGLIFQLLKVFRIIKVLHPERFPEWQENLIVVSNHPSLVEAFLLPALFFPEYFFYPSTLTPWSTPDKANFYRPWYFFWIRPRAIPIDRRSAREELRAFFEIKDVLKKGGRVILFPEGGRTFKGTDFAYSKKGKRIRPLKEGIAWLCLKTEALVLPIWVEGTDAIFRRDNNQKSGITIKIGGLMRFCDFQFCDLELTNKQIKAIIINRITERLLQLADEE